jgi:hypothetical protein
MLRKDFKCCSEKSEGLQLLFKEVEGFRKSKHLNIGKAYEALWLQGLIRQVALG